MGDAQMSRQSADSIHSGSSSKPANNNNNNNNNNGSDLDIARAKRARAGAEAGTHLAAAFESASGGPQPPSQQQQHRHSNHHHLLHHHQQQAPRGQEPSPPIGAKHKHHHLSYQHLQQPQPQPQPLGPSQAAAAALAGSHQRLVGAGVASQLHRPAHHHSAMPLGGLEGGGGGGGGGGGQDVIGAGSAGAPKLAGKSATSILMEAGGDQQPSQRHQQQANLLDRSDSASLPSSNASTSDSMFKRPLGASGKWHRKIFGCADQAGSDASSHSSNEGAIGDLVAAGKRAGAPKRTGAGGAGRGADAELARARARRGGACCGLSWAALLFGLLLVGALLVLLFHFKLFGFSISCSFQGNSTRQPIDGAASAGSAVTTGAGFNLKNGAEYYMGITEMLQAMDNTVDPCSDFYNYACGAWTRRHSIPADESRIDTFSVMRSDLGNKLRDLLEEEIDSQDSEASVKVKTLYRSCINESLIEQRGPEPLIQLLNSHFGGWPLLGATSGNDENNNNNNNSIQANDLANNWVQLMAVLRTYNNEIIIGQTVGSHEHNSSMHAIRLYPAGLGLPSADYYNASSRQFKAYEKYIISTAQLLRANNSNLMSDIRDLLEFETGLANISKPFERQGGATYHRMSISRLQKYTPAIDWDTYFKYAFPDVAINSTEQIGLYGLDFFMDIAHLINQTASKKTVINYLLWRFVMNRVNNLGKQFADNQHEYAAEISGAKVQAPRHKVCVDYVNGNMGMAVSSLYVRRHFDVGSKQQAEIMIANIRQAFLEILNQVDWMDSETRQEAIVKAKSMLQHIGFPLWITDPVQLDAEYTHLNFSSEGYFENVIQLIQSFAKETRQKLRQPSERDKWTVAPSIINAHYLRTKNLMSFPAGILQPPIYHTRYPKSLNYGGIGSIIGHEITHGFDNDGRHHDYQGNQRLWWHPNTIDRFIMRSQCMVRQYDDYFVDIKGENVTVSGIRTLGENIADNGGLKEAFMAYRQYELENGPEDMLPGLNLTHHQMFFIKFAQNWCQNMTPQSMMNALKTWRHPLGRFRVIGTLSNLNEFATAFNCPAGAVMNPVAKCKVW